MSTESEERELSPLSKEMMLERHRALLVQGQWLPGVHRTQLIIVTIAIWLLPNHSVWISAAALIMSTLIVWSWVVQLGRYRHQLFVLEEAIASVAMADRKRRWEDSYIRFRYESEFGSWLARLEPFLWWLSAVASITPGFLSGLVG